ncbi:uncharacterized protein DUF3710 [Rarobacter incanus]|uniref:Uncharacterized protein DUF3710 n=1 Tax=Rarobacter incanus TaxID=153494 RepID=A0A542SMU6_9MICO|nr:uncharacterized protein DUF3710 [Rarobacter incanus]
MGLFGRKKSAEKPAVAGDEATGDGAVDTVADATAKSGPYDVAERPELGNLIDFGVLRVPGIDGMNVRLQSDPNDVIGGIAIEVGKTNLQLNAFAAPKSAGIWDEVRDEIAASLTADGGFADVVQGPFGKELQARIPVRTARGGNHGHAPARFIGIDGPRWMLRAVITGEGATAAAAAEQVESLIAGTVVVRGSEARPPREILPLTAPVVAGQRPAAPQGATDKDFNPLERGPEITEVR